MIVVVVGDGLARDVIRFRQQLSVIRSILIFEIDGGKLPVGYSWIGWGGDQAGSPVPGVVLISLNQILPCALGKKLHGSQVAQSIVGDVFDDGVGGG